MKEQIQMTGFLEERIIDSFEGSRKIEKEFMKMYNDAPKFSKHVITA